MAISKTYFEERVIDSDMPAANMQMAANIFRPSLKEYLELYTSITKFFSNMEKALEEENFKRMALYNVEIANAVEKYLKKEKLVIVDKKYVDDYSESFKKDLLANRKKIEDIVKDLLNEKKSKKSESFENKRGEILKQITIFKNKILDFISSTANTNKKLTVKKTSEEEKEKNRKKLEENQEQAYYDSFFTKDISNLLLSPIIKPTKSLFNLADRIDRRISVNFSLMSRSISSTSKKISEDFKKSTLTGIMTLSKNIFKVLGKTLKTTVGLSIKFLSFALKTAFTLKSLIKIFYFWGGFILKPVKAALSLASKTISIAFSGIKFLANSILRIGTVVFKTVSLAVKNTFVLASKVVKKIGEFSIVKFLKKTFLAFFSTYPGAFILGYVSGTIWGLILRFAGVSDEDIKSGNYKILDDVVFPLFGKIKDRVTGFFANIKKKFNTTAEEYSQAFKESAFGSMIISAFKSIKETGKNLFPVVLDLSQNLYKTGKGLAFVVAELVKFFAGKDAPSVKDFSRINTGAYAGLRVFKKFPKIRSGLAGMIAVALTLGSTAISKMFGGGGAEEQKNNSKYPVFVNVRKKTAKILYNIGDSKEEQYGSVKIKTTAELKYNFLKSLQDQYDKANNDNKKTISKKIDVAKKIFDIFIKEKDSLDYIQRSFEYMMEQYYENRSFAKKFDFKNVSLIEDILTHNGNPIIEMNSFWKIFSENDEKTKLAMFAFLANIINARIDLFDNDISTFYERMKNSKDDLVDFKDLLENRKYLQISSLAQKDLNNNQPLNIQELSVVLNREKSYSGAEFGNQANILNLSLNTATKPLANKVRKQINTAKILWETDYADKLTNPRKANDPTNELKNSPPGTIFKISTINGGVKFAVTTNDKSKPVREFTTEEGVLKYLMDNSSEDEVFQAALTTQEATEDLTQNIKLLQQTPLLVSENFSKFIEQLQELTKQFQDRFLKSFFPNPPFDKNSNTAFKTFVEIIDTKRLEEINHMKEPSYFNKEYGNKDNISNIATSVFRKTINATRKELENNTKEGYEDILDILKDNNENNIKINKEIQTILDEINNDGFAKDRNKILSDFKSLLSANTEKQ